MSHTLRAVAAAVMFAAPVAGHAQMCWSESPSLKPAPNSWQGSQGENYAAQASSGVALYGAYWAGTRVGGSVYSKASGAARMGTVGGVPGYGKLAASIPFIGTGAAAVPIVPTTLGQTPFLGGVVESIPIVGGTIAGPPHPAIVGAVAVDTYALPKFTPGGYTESSVFTMTDFNSPPRLRHYKNYLAPMPYTHPPIYAPALGTEAVPTEQIEAVAERFGLVGEVDIPN